MRDILLTVFIAGLLPFVLRRPEIGAYLWVWLGMMNPHKLTYGFAHSLPFAYIAAILTIIGFVFNRQKKRLPINGGVVLLLALFAWMTVTSVFSINDSNAVWERWTFVLKINFMLLLTLMLLRGRKQIDWLVWVMVVSIGFYGVKGGIWTLATGGGSRVWGPPGGMLEDNNSLAIGLVMILPLMFYLQQTATRRWLRYALLACMVFVGFSILGTQSRGALLAVLAITFVLGLKSKYPVRSSLLLFALASAAVVYMPESWVQRMDTIQDYTDDSSAMSRIYTWLTLWNVALSRPLVGAGFAADNLAVFLQYAPTYNPYDVFQGRVYVAHSIYLQAIGEHGFPGLLLFLALGFWVWRAAGSTARLAEAQPDLANWVPLLMRMCQVATLGFAVGGAFLSLMNLDVPYYLLAIVVLTQVTIQEQLKSRPAGARDATPVSPFSRDQHHVVLGPPPA